jgi:hypothetical protein
VADHSHRRQVAAGHSRVVAAGHSRVVAAGHSRVVAAGHSQVVAAGHSRTVVRRTRQEEGPIQAVARRVPLAGRSREGSTRWLAANLRSRRGLDRQAVNLLSRHASLGGKVVGTPDCPPQTLAAGVTAMP